MSGTMPDREGHVDQWPFLTAYPLLSCTAGKLVTNYGIPLSKVECSYHGNLIRCQLTKQYQHLHCHPNPHAPGCALHHASRHCTHTAHAHTYTHLNPQFDVDPLQWLCPCLPSQQDHLVHICWLQTLLLLDTPHPGEDLNVAERGSTPRCPHYATLLAHSGRTSYKQPGCSGLLYT